MKKYKTDIVCIGVLVADMLAKPITKMPNWRELEIIEDFEFAAGGGAHNTSVCLSKLGINVSVIGKIGNDYWGDLILQNLQNNGVNTAGIGRCKSHKTSFSFVAISQCGERAFFHHIGANNTMSIDDINLSIIEESRVLHISGTMIMPLFDGVPTANILKHAKNNQVITCLDTVWNNSVDNLAIMEPSLPYIDYLIPSIDEARKISNCNFPSDIATFFLDRGVMNVILKMGSEGCFVKNKNIELYFPSFKIKTVDTCGAGDSFVGGFLAGVIKNLNITDCCNIGNSAGALCVSAIGSTSGIKNWSDTVSFMEQSKK